MKQLFKIGAVLFAFTLLASCKANHGTVKSSTAPGKVKKVTGAKSAKAHAPGQQKKKNRFILD